MNFFVPIRPLLKGWLLSFVGFGFVAFLISAQFLSSNDAGVAVAVKSSLRDFLPWAAVTPLLYRFVARFPLGVKKWPSRDVLHFVVCLATLTLFHWWKETIDPGFRAGPGGPNARLDRGAPRERRAFPPPAREKTRPDGRS